MNNCFGQAGQQLRTAESLDGRTTFFVHEQPKVEPSLNMCACGVAPDTARGNYLHFSRVGKHVQSSFIQTHASIW